MGNSVEFHGKAKVKNQKNLFSTIPSSINRTLIKRFRGLQNRSFWLSLLFSKVGLLAFVITAVLVFNVAVQVRLNIWHRDFFNAIEQKSLPLIGDQILWFGLIGGSLLCAVVAQTFAHELLKVRLRERLTNGLLRQWMRPGEAYRYRMSSADHANPDQRIHEDVRQLSELSADLGIGILQSSLMLLSFIAVLWLLSSGIVLPIGGYVFSIPGYMVWCAIGYAIAGSYLAWRVGRPLMALNAQRYAREADFRFALVRANESAESIALSKGEADERAHLNGAFGSVLGVARKAASATARLTWVTSGYGWIGIVFPVLVAMPGYMQGHLSLGGLMMVVGAFNQVQVALKWFVDNFARIADWAAVLGRVNELRRALAVHQTEPSPGGSSLRAVTSSGGALILRNVNLRSPCGRLLIRDASCVIRAGERVMISGASGLGKSTLFRAMAGLWTWGEGLISTPAQNVMFLPQRPYLPLGSLRQAVVYPGLVASFGEADIAVALGRVGLSELVPSLDIDDRWDQRLSAGQQQRLAFARLLLHKPEWVFLDEATSALDEANQRISMSIFDKELPDCTVISIAHNPELEAFHERVLRVVAGENGARLAEKPRDAAIIVSGRTPLPKQNLRQAPRLGSSGLYNLASPGRPPIELGRSVGSRLGDSDPGALERKSDAFAMLGANIEAFRMRKRVTVAPLEDKPVVIKLKGQSVRSDGGVGAA